MKAARSASTRVLMSYALFAALLAFASLALFGCYYAEMRDDEAVQAYNEEFPQMPKKTIPVNGGVWVEREANPMELVNPLADNSKMIAWGWERYRFYCVQCHGPMLDGNGTVGQSFAPCPTTSKVLRCRSRATVKSFIKSVSVSTGILPSMPPLQTMKPGPLCAT